MRISGRKSLAFLEFHSEITDAAKITVLGVHISSKFTLNRTEIRQKLSLKNMNIVEGKITFEDKFIN